MADFAAAQYQKLIIAVQVKNFTAYFAGSTTRYWFGGLGESFSS